MALSVFSTLGGLLLLSLASFPLQPFTVTEKVRVDRSRVYADETLTLTQGTSKEYRFDSVMENLSIMEIDMYGTDFFRFEIVDLHDNNTVFVKERTRTGPLFWTPPTGSGWDFVFSNPFRNTTTLTLSIKEYYLKAVEDKNVTYYRSLLDPAYACVGVGLIVFGIVLDSAIIGYQRFKATRNNHKENSRSHQYRTDTTRL